jgi:superfamily II DNA/RNA helicase
MYDRRPNNRSNNNNRSGGGYGSRPRFQNNRGGRGGGRGGFRGQQIDSNKYVKKAAGVVEVAEYVPTHKFADFAVDERLKANIIKKGYETPTPIQDQAIPHLLEGKDLIGLANTGTGKTAAFLIPLIDKMLKDVTQSALIIVPTRELAVQIEDELKGFNRGLNMLSAICIGGANMSLQIRNLKNDPEFVIGTPGRLKDLAKRGNLDLSKYNNIVLDEVDRMLDMGFVDDIKQIIATLPKEKQSLFFSATLPRESEVLMQGLLVDPVTVSVRTGETSDNVDQDVVKVKKEEKFDALHDLLSKVEFTKVLVFGKTKHGVEKISDGLTQRGHKSVSIHGNKSQSQRQRALTQFKSNQAKIMVATDVAARGLDIPDVSHVINFDEPATYSDYTHRIGRTGRAGKKGFALTFVEVR